MMMSHHPGKMLPPGNTRKRKLAEADKLATPEAAKPTPSNQLLAGYLAHEFLTKGTLLGQKFDPVSAQAGSDTSSGSISAEPEMSQPNSQAAASASVREEKEHESYGGVANIMKSEGTHIKGIVNPTQLSWWIHM